MRRKLKGGRIGESRSLRKMRLNLLNINKLSQNFKKSWDEPGTIKFILFNRPY